MNWSKDPQIGELLHCCMGIYAQQCNNSPPRWQQLCNSPRKTTCNNGAITSNKGCNNYPIFRRVVAPYCTPSPVKSG